MAWILNLFQIKTVRSAWVFLVGSALMFFFGVYLLTISPTPSPNEPRPYFEITIFSFWFLLVGSYIFIASWALFSAKGREHLVTQEQILVKSKRTISWYVKFLFACYAASFATLMILGIILLPFAGYAGLEAMFSPNSSLYFLFAGLVWSPLIFRHLK